ncbi:MAG: hypothetical protein AAF433_03135 [Bacteroidota bacterium]
MLSRIAERKGHEGSIYQLQRAADGKGLLSVAGDGWLVYWPEQAEEHGKLLAKVASGQLLCALALTGERLVTGDLTGGLHWLYPGSDGQQNKHLAHHRKGVFALQRIDDQLFSAGGDGFLSRWSIAESRVLESLPLSQQSLRCLAYYADKDLLAVGSTDQHIYLIRASSMQLLNQWRAHDNSVFSIAFSPDGQQLISGGRDAMLKVWQLTELATKPVLLQDIPAHNFTVNSLAFSPKGQFLATGSRDKTLKIWRTADWELLKVAEPIRDRGHVNSINSLCWLSEQELVTAGDDRRILSWLFEPS